MAERSVAKIAWAVLLIAMGILLCVKEPYAIRQSPNLGFLSLARYFIAAFLIYAGGLRLHRLYFRKDKESPPDE